MLVPSSFLLKRVEEKYAACTAQSNHSAKSTKTKQKYSKFEMRMSMLTVYIPERAINVQEDQISKATLKKLQLNHKQAYN
jgi:hypothetical protein